MINMSTFDPSTLYECAYNTELNEELVASRGEEDMVGEFFWLLHVFYLFVVAVN